MKVVDIRIDHFFAIVINVEKAYRDEGKVLESVNEFLNAYLKNNELIASDRELVQWLIQNCQRSFNDLSRAFSAKNTQFVQRINDLLEKKLELLYVNLPEEKMLQQVTHLKITADKLLGDLKEWASQIIPVRAFKLIFGKNQFADEKLYRDWQRKLDQVKAELCQIRYYLTSSFDSLRKVLPIDETVSGASGSTNEPRTSFGDDDWESFMGKSFDQKEIVRPSTDSLKSFTNQENQMKLGEQVAFKDERLNKVNSEPDFISKTAQRPDASRIDLLKAFTRLKEENDLLNQTYLHQNVIIQKMRKLFETKIRELANQTAVVNQQQQVVAQKRLSDLTNENTLLKEKLSSLEKKDKEVSLAGISRKEIEHDWKLLLDDLSLTEPTEINVFHDLCDELNNKNQEIGDLNRQVRNLKQQNLWLKNAWFKSSQLICNEVIKLLNGFRVFSDQVKEGVNVIGAGSGKLENESLSANYLKAFMTIRRSVELLKRIYLHNLLGQVQ